jgi:hypothetical protein
MGFSIQPPCQYEISKPVSSPFSKEEAKGRKFLILQNIFKTILSGAVFCPSFVFITLPLFEQGAQFLYSPVENSGTMPPRPLLGNGDGGI